ncbi:MAG: type VI secretion system baseplate subunit TssF [Candidatus Eisenbacteria bacterium]
MLRRAVVGRVRVSAARIQLKLDSEFPRFTQHLLEMTYPHYLCPTPSMAVVCLQPDRAEGRARRRLRRQARHHSAQPARQGDQTACGTRSPRTRRSGPCRSSKRNTSPTSRTSNVPRIDLRRLKAGLRIRLRTTAGLTFDKISLSSLRLFLRGTDQRPMRLYEQLIQNSMAVIVRPPAKTWNEVPPSTRIQGWDSRTRRLCCHSELARSRAIASCTSTSRSRSVFFSLRSGIGPGGATDLGVELEIVVLFDRSDPVLENAVDANEFALHCTPAINLFSAAAIVSISSRRSTSIWSYPTDASARLRGLSAARRDGHGTAAETSVSSCRSTRRRSRPVSGSLRLLHDAPDAAHALLEAATRRAAQHYIGSEVYLSLVDAKEAPFRGDLRQLSVTALCTNRDLPLHMPVGQGDTDFTLESGAPVESVRCLAGPTKPRLPSSEGDVVWRFISHLSLNYLTLCDTDRRQGAAALRDLLSLYGDIGEAHIRKQIDGVRSVAAKPVVRRIPTHGPIAFGRGLELTVTCDETSFEGTGAFLLGAVLDRFFAKYVSINSFTETVVRAVDRGEIARWPVRTGHRHAV